GLRAAISRAGGWWWEIRRALRMWVERRRLGLPPLRTPPVTEIEAFDPNGYERGGFAAQPVEVRPYDNTAIGFLTDGAILELDDPGIHVIQDVARWRGPDGE